jgi:hypothetical protein
MLAWHPVLRFFLSRDLRSTRSFWRLVSAYLHDHRLLCHIIHGTCYHVASFGSERSEMQLTYICRWMVDLFVSDLPLVHWLWLIVKIFCSTELYNKPAIVLGQQARYVSPLTGATYQKLLGPAAKAQLTKNPTSLHCTHSLREVGSANNSLWLELLFPFHLTFHSIWSCDSEMVLIMWFRHRTSWPNSPNGTSLHGFVQSSLGDYQIQSKWNM